MIKNEVCGGESPMYAIIADSGRQFTVKEGDVLTVDYREAEKGATIDFDAVLAVSSDSGLTLGKPHVDGAKVSAEVLGPKLGKKLVVQKFRRRKNSRRKTGHRQMNLEVKIGSIMAPGIQPAAAATTPAASSTDSPSEDASGAAEE